MINLGNAYGEIQIGTDQAEQKVQSLATTMRTIGTTMSLGITAPLVGIGIDSFSITPAAVGPVKAMIRSIDAAAVRTKVEALLAKPTGNMRKSLHDWAKRQGVSLG